MFRRLVTGITVAFLSASAAVASDARSFHMAQDALEEVGSSTQEPMAFPDCVQEFRSLVSTWSDLGYLLRPTENLNLRIGHLDGKISIRIPEESDLPKGDFMIFFECGAGLVSISAVRLS